MCRTLPLTVPPTILTLPDGENVQFGPESTAVQDHSVGNLSSFGRYHHVVGAYQLAIAASSFHPFNPENRVVRFRVLEHFFLLENERDISNEDNSLVFVFRSVEPEVPFCQFQFPHSLYVRSVDFVSTFSRVTYIGEVVEAL